MGKTTYCINHECFQNSGHLSCLVLSSSYGSKVCPFFKTQKQVDREREKAHQRLVDLGLDDLIKVYEYNSLRRW